MKRAAFLIACILLLSFVTTASAILSLSNADVYPSEDYLRPGERVNVSATVEIIPSGAMTFASGHTLVFSTDLENAHWDVRVMVDGIQAAVILKDTDHLFVNGYILSYPTDRDVSVSIEMVGNAPPSMDDMPQTVLRIAELNNQGVIVGGSEKSIQRIVRPSPVSASPTIPHTAVATARTSTADTHTVDFPFLLIIAGLFCALLSLKRRLKLR
jgi:hypothetical protein